MKLKGIWILWIDSVASGEWTDYEKPTEVRESRPKECLTVGVLLEETKDSYTVTVAKTEDLFVLGTLSIPKCSVLMAKKIKLPKKIGKMLWREND